MKSPLTPIIIIVAFVGLLQACDKNSGKKTAEVSTNIIGSWELRETTAAMTPEPLRYSPGNGNVIMFTTDSFHLIADGKITRRGKYTIVPDSTVGTNVCLELPKGQYPHRIIYDGDVNSAKQFLELSGSRLKFISGCYALDAGHTTEYEKLTEQ